jgi:hypothetical protein
MKKSKAMDMRFHWIRDRIRHQHMQVTGQEWENNLADFFTKAIPSHTHQARMKELMQIPIKDNNHFDNIRANRANAFRRKIEEMKLKQLCNGKGVLSLANVPKALKSKLKQAIK